MDLSLKTWSAIWQKSSAIPLLVAQFVCALLPQAMRAAFGFGPTTRMRAVSLCIPDR